MTTSGTGERRKRRRGLTLIELLTVITILALVLGIGVAVLGQTRKDLALQAVAGQFSTILRYTRATAVYEHAPALVVVDPDNHRLYSIVKRTIGLWHGEDREGTGAFGRSVKLSGGRIAPGRFGNGFVFERGGYAETDEAPLLAPDQGLILEAWVCTTLRTEQVVLEQAGVYSLRIRADGVPAVRMMKLETAGTGHAVPLNQWCRLMAVYDGETLGLFAGDTLLASAKGSLKLPSLPRRLTFGSPASPFYGGIDEVRVSALIASPQQEFGWPESVSLAMEGGIGSGPGPRRISFDADGRLESSRHNAPIRFSLSSSEGISTMTLNRMGTVE